MSSSQASARSSSSLSEASSSNSSASDRAPRVRCDGGQRVAFGLHRVVAANLARARHVNWRAARDVDKRVGSQGSGQATSSQAPHCINLPRIEHSRCAAPRPRLSRVHSAGRHSARLRSRRGRAPCFLLAWRADFTDQRLRVKAPFTISPPTVSTGRPGSDCPTTLARRPRVRKAITSSTLLGVGISAWLFLAKQRCAQQDPLCFHTSPLEP